MDFRGFALASVAIAGLGSAAVAQEAPPFGGEEDQAYAAALWERMTEMRLVGEDAILAFPYEGSDPHGAMLETFYAGAEVEGHNGALVVKRNYAPTAEGVDGVLGASDEHLAAITIMFKREEGYDPETRNWFYAKYLPDGSLDQNPAGTPLAGLVGKGADAGCIACHQGAGEDYLFTTDADLSVLTQ